jgi:hypothetical protein
MLQAISMMNLYLEIILLGCMPSVVRSRRIPQALRIVMGLAPRLVSDPSQLRASCKTGE